MSTTCLKMLLAVVTLWLAAPRTAAAAPTDESGGGEASGEAADEAPSPVTIRRTRDKRAALVYGPLGTPVSRSDTQALLDYRLGTDLGMPGRVVSLDEIPIPLGDPLWVLGGDDDQLCSSGEAAPDWAAAIDTAREQLDSLQTETAQQTLDEVLSQLACADAVVEREILGTMYMMRGLARFFEERAEAARQDFRRAVTVNPSIEWDPNYPPEPQQVYLKAREDIYLPGRGRVEASFLSGEVLEVVVDGQSFTAGEPGGLDVHPGYHLLQYLMPDKSLHSRVTYVEGGETRLLLSRAGMEHAVLVGGSQPSNAPVARILLNNLCALWNVDNIYVADVTSGAGDEAYVYRFSREGARFERMMPRTVAEDETQDATEVSAIEGLLVLPNAVAEGASSTITVESAQVGDDSRIYLGPYEVQNLARVGVRTTFNLPDKIPAGVYNVRVVAPQGGEVTFPRAFSVIGDTRTETQEQPVVYVTRTTAIPSEPSERLRIGTHWGFARHRGTWALLDVEMDVRLGEGFCLDAAVGARMVEGYYPHAYWRAGFKVRWYPKVVQGYFSLNFMQYFEDLEMGPRAAVGIDVVIPSMKNFYFNVETGGGVLFETSADVFGIFHIHGGVGMRF